jgi:protein SCO1/2
LISGEFELIDHHGNQVTERSFDGSLRLVFFGFTQCPDVCPTTMLEIRNAMRELGDDASQVQPLFISIDRINDNVEVLATYVGAFGPTFVGLTGSEQQIDAAAAAFNVTYGVQPGSQSATGNDTIFHSAYLFLMDRQGDFLDVFGYGTKSATIASRIREYL